MRQILHLAALGIALLLPAQADAADKGQADADENKTLEQLVYEIDQMRNFDKTPFKKAEQRAEQLLERFKAPEEQALIYYTVAHVYAQSGQLHPDRTVHFAKKALALPLDPLKALKMYMSWGNAVESKFRRAKLKDNLAERKETAKVYLLGMKFCLGYNVTDMPLPPPPPRGIPNGGGPGAGPAVEAAREEYRQYLLELKEVELNNEMIELRGIFEDLILGLKLSEEDLTNLAKEVTENDKAKQRILGQIRTRKQNKEAS